MDIYNKYYIKSILVASICILLFGSLVYSKEPTSKEYALMGKVTVKAFKGHIFAAAAEKSDLADKLFKFGHHRGMIFLKALKEEKVSHKDVVSVVPIIVTTKVRSRPCDSYEFILGMLYADLFHETYSSLYKDGLGDAQLIKQLAESKLEEGNYELLLEE